jgi:hypothetical protein
MEDHECIHEKDFGVLFTKVDMMTETLKTQSIAMDSLKIAINAAIQYQTSMETINKIKKEKKEMSLQRAIFYSSIILGVCGIITAFIIEFHV